MRVLVACEFSGIVRDAFAKRGHDARSASRVFITRSAITIWRSVAPTMSLVRRSIAHVVVAFITTHDGTRNRYRVLSALIFYQ
jgi:hypothetical protein